jgi:hypothetical protein
LIADDQPYTFLYQPTEPIVLDRRVVRVEHSPDGSEVYRKIEPSSTGSIDTFFGQWRKLSQEPSYAP